MFSSSTLRAVYLFVVIFILSVVVVSRECDCGQHPQAHHAYDQYCQYLFRHSIFPFTLFSPALDRTQRPYRLTACIRMHLYLYSLCAVSPQALPKNLFSRTHMYSPSVRSSAPALRPGIPHNLTMRSSYATAGMNT